MSFKIRKEEFENGGKFVEIIPGNYGICVCLKALEDNSYRLIKYENLSKSGIAKTLADYLVNDNLSLKKILVSDETFVVPESRRHIEIKEKFQKILEKLDG